MEMLNGYKTYLAVAGLLGLALHQFSQGSVDLAFQSLMGALAAFGLRQAINGSQGKA
jgi:hypothetical protein